MMGRLNHDQAQLFYSFCLEEVVPDDHLIREIAAVLDLSWVHAELAPYYSSTGRPSIDPVLMIRMLIVGYVFALRSERLLCREVQLNLAYRWFCGLSIEDKIPDHSAFSRARNERFRESDIFRRVFERLVAACIAAGLVGGQGFAVDASLIVADANKQRSIPGSDWKKDHDPQDASRAMKEYLATLDDAAFGAASNVTPKFVSPSDPAAQWTGAMRGPAFFAYADNYLIDVKFGVIMDVEASRAIRQAEVGTAKVMIERTEERFGIKPEYLAADTAYGSAATLNWLVTDKKIAPHAPTHDYGRARACARHGVLVVGEEMKGLVNCNFLPGSARRLELGTVSAEPLSRAYWSQKLRPLGETVGLSRARTSGESPDSTQAGRGPQWPIQLAAISAHPAAMVGTGMPKLRGRTGNEP
jgi:transposase